MIVHLQHSYGQLAFTEISEETWRLTRSILSTSHGGSEAEPPSGITLQTIKFRP